MSVQYNPTRRLHDAIGAPALVSAQPLFVNVPVDLERISARLQNEVEDRARRSGQTLI